MAHMSVSYLPFTQIVNIHLDRETARRVASVLAIDYHENHEEEIGELSTMLFDELERSS